MQSTLVVPIIIADPFCIVFSPPPRFSEVIVGTLWTGSRLLEAILRTFKGRGRSWNCLDFCFTSTGSVCRWRRSGHVRRGNAVLNQASGALFRDALATAGRWWLSVCLGKSESPPIFSLCQINFWGTTCSAMQYVVISWYNSVRLSWVVEVAPPRKK